MFITNLGIILVLISALGYLCNLLNWRFLNYKIISLLYYIGAFVHEFSHAIACVLTGARIQEFSVFSKQPHVLHQKSKIPILGEFLISLAPLAGGLLFLYLINFYFFKIPFADPQLKTWQDIFFWPINFFFHINFLRWQSWLAILLFFNVGAMIGPSFKDLLNIWPLVIVLFFVNSSFFANLGLFVVALIVANLMLQIIAILIIKIIKLIL